MTLIHVTQDDIENGNPDDRLACPIALALRRTLCLSDGDVQVTGQRICVQQCDRDLWMYAPDEAVDFVGKFDAECEYDEPELLGPFSFWLDLPD